MERIQKILGELSLPKSIATDLEVKQEDYKLNCENTVGTVQIPLGIAGPILFDEKRYVVPIATTEAALVASINRGCKVLNLGSDLQVRVKKIGITRAPVYECKKIKSEEFYKQWFKKNLEILQAKISETSKFTKILDFKVKKYKGHLFVKFYFDTADAMGMNMATIACENMNQIICSELNAKCIALSSNFCSDKKPSLVNIKEGRGYKVLTSVYLSNQVIQKNLKCDAKSLFKAYQLKIRDGSKLAKAICGNSHIANVVAGIFLATGQDAAHIGESSLGDTIIKKNPHGLTFEIKLNGLVLGTHGGGTGLPTQKEALDLIGLQDTSETGEKTLELAKVVALACLAGEISLLGSIAEGSLATTHEKYRKGNI